MSYELPNIYTSLIIIIFLVVLIVIAYFIKLKSKSLKKIINNKKRINVVEYLPIRGGFSSFIINVDNKKFFFIAHRSGNANLIQISSDTEKNNTLENINKSPDQININSDKVNSQKTSLENKNNDKPLQHVNISDLLALHKKRTK